MKAYPLIYSRTKNDDFVPDFLTRPADLDWQTALKYITSVIANLDTLNGIRYCTFSVDNYCIGGISCITKTLVNQLEKTSELSSDMIYKANNYLKDCKGRNIAAFIGFAVPKSEIRNGKIPDIKLSEYWTVYQEYLEHQWEKSHTESEKLSYPTVELNEKIYNYLHQPDIEMIRQKYIVKGFHDAEQATLDYFFDRIMNHKENVSFISDIIYKEDWDKMYFTHAYVSDVLYKSIISSTEREVKTVMSRTTVQKGSAGTQANRYESMFADYKNSKSTIPAPQEKPLDSGEKTESRGSKKNMGLFDRIYSAVADTGNSYNSPEIKPTNKNSTYYEKIIVNGLNKYAYMAEWANGNKLCEISMRRSHSLYEQIQQYILDMFSAEQKSYQYIKNVLFLLDEKKIRILFK